MNDVPTHSVIRQKPTPLAERLKDEIRRNGPLPVQTYMSRCLWDEQYGYYATRRVLGADGDFITASEISQTFGELIGLWAAVVWQERMGAPSSVSLCEYGPGRGTLMFDALRATRIVKGFQDAASLHLVEMSQTLMAAQRATLQHAALQPTWHSNLASIPSPAIIVANEFIDSWPVTQWVKTATDWRMRSVGLAAQHNLAFMVEDRAETAPSADLAADLAQAFSQSPPGTIVERHDLSLLARALKALSDDGPLAVLLIDYGHTQPLSGDTLQAVRGHTYEHPLHAPGEADLSAQVNFFDLAIALHGVGLALDGPVTQSEFLGSLGILERASRLMHANPERAGAIETGIARLMAPNGMGTRFKVLGVRSPTLAPLPGFAAAS